ncbi:MAG: hypothetical protein ACQZ2J_21925 [Pseudomonas piscis]|uniref:hypothetical protein n=1 Tax=Pseudomonas piscis TaxID=2614538 RepID=UPI003D291D11
MLFIFPTVAALALALLFWRRQKALVALRREAFIRDFSLPPGLFTPLRARHPQLTLKDCQLVAQVRRRPSSLRRSAFWPRAAAGVWCRNWPKALWQNAWYSRVWRMNSCHKSSTTWEGIDT